MSSSLTYVFTAHKRDLSSPPFIPPFTSCYICNSIKGRKEKGGRLSIISTTECFLVCFFSCFFFFFIQQLLSHEKQKSMIKWSIKQFIPPLSSGLLVVEAELVAPGATEQDSLTGLFFTTGSLCAPHPHSLWHVAQLSPVALRPVSLHSAHITLSMTPWQR